MGDYYTLKCNLKVNLQDFEEERRFLNDLLDLYKDLDSNKIDKMIGEGVVELAYPELCDTIENAIDEFYDAYDQIYYHRKHRLYDAVKIQKIKNDQDIEVLYGEEYFPEYPRVEREGYMYDLIFLNGYHGGARDGKKHPDGKTPYWRTPFPELSKWGRPAVQTESLKSLVDRYQNDFMKDRGRIIVDMVLSDILGRYRAIHSMFDIEYL